MSEYESLRTDIEGIGTRFLGLAETQGHFNESIMTQHERLWDEVATLRDELHAVANRLEALTRGLTTEAVRGYVRLADDLDAS